MCDTQKLKKNICCNICNKLYSSKNSLCNHKKIYHKSNNIIIQNTNQNINKDINQNTEINNELLNSNGLITSFNNLKQNNIFNCNYCNKIFTRKNNLNYHIKNKCKEKNNIYNKIIEENNNLKKEIDNIKNKMINEIDNLKNQILNLLNNKELNINSNNNINNGTVINNTYVKFGLINYSKILSEKSILNILNKPFKCLEESIKTIHFNPNLPEYNNVYITNMKDDIAYIFDGEKFIAIKKNDLINEIIENHKDQIEESMEEYKSKLKPHTIKQLDKFLALINNENEGYVDGHKKSYQNYKVYKMSDIKILLYNSTDSKKLDSLKNMELKKKIIIDD